MKRVITAVVAIALLSFAPLALSTSASAAEATPGFSESQSAERPSAEARRTLTIRGFKKNGQLFARGKASPNYRFSTVIIKRRVCESCRFKTYNRVKTDRRGEYRSRIAAPGRVGPSWDYISFVPKRGDYLAKRSDRIVSTFSSRG